MNWMDSLSTMPNFPSVFPPAAGEQPGRVGFHIRRAGVGVFAVQTIREIHQNPAFAEYQRWKREIDEATTGEMAAAIVAVVRAWQPVIPRDWLVTYPPAGASRGGQYPTGFLAKAVASLLDLDCLDTLVRNPADRKTHHMAVLALKQFPFTVSVVPPSVALVVDDFCNTGSTMRLSLAALRGAGCPAFGFSWGAA